MEVYCAHNPVILDPFSWLKECPNKITSNARAMQFTEVEWFNVGEAMTQTPPRHIPTAWRGPPPDAREQPAPVVREGWPGALMPRHMTRPLPLDPRASVPGHCVVPPARRRTNLFQHLSPSQCPWCFSVACAVSPVSCEAEIIRDTHGTEGIRRAFPRHCPWYLEWKEGWYLNQLLVKVVPQIGWETYLFWKVQK